MFVQGVKFKCTYEAVQTGLKCMSGTSSVKLIEYIPFLLFFSFFFSGGCFLFAVCAFTCHVFVVCLKTKGKERKIEAVVAVILDAVDRG